MLRSILLLTGILGLISINIAADAATPAVVLVENKQARAVIIVDEQANEYTRQAAGHIQDYIQKMTGASLPLVSDPAQAGDRSRIWVGDHAGLKQLYASEPRLNVTFKDYDEVLLYAGQRDVVLRGRDRTMQGVAIEVGTYLAVQRFLIEKLEIRWLWPGELGTDIPKRNTLTIEPFFQNYAPQLKYRRIRGVEYEYRWGKNPFAIPGIEDPKAYTLEMDEQVRTWLNHHNIDGRMRGRGDGKERPIIGGQTLTPATGHYFSHWHSKYYNKHPEWFALQPDGSRGTFPPRLNRTKLCVSNPGVVDQYIKEAVEFFTKNPQYDTIGIMPNDNGWLGYCVCSNCKAWDPPDAPNSERPIGYANNTWIESKSLTDRKIRFWNEASRRLKKEFPDRDLYILGLAYNAYRQAPVEQKLEDNILIMFEGILQRQRTQNNVKDIEKHKELWVEWSKQTSHIVWRPNFRMSQPGDPYVHLKLYGETVNFLANNNAKGIDIDTMMNNYWASHGPQYYLAATMIWRPDADHRQIMDDYYARAFGPAAKPIQAYYQLFENLYTYLAENYESWSAHRHIPNLYRELTIPPHPPADTMKYLGIDPKELQTPNARPIESRAESLLNEARRLAAGADPVYLKRVEFVAVGLAYTTAHLDTLEALGQLRRQPRDEQLISRANAAYQRQQQILTENLHNHALNYINARNYELDHQPSLVPPAYRDKSAKP